jgi:hypothetical protein
LDFFGIRKSIEVFLYEVMTWLMSAPIATPLAKKETRFFPSGA